MCSLAQTNKSGRRLSPKVSRLNAEARDGQKLRIAPEANLPGLSTLLLTSHNDGHSCIETCLERPELGPGSFAPACQISRAAEVEIPAYD